MSENEEEIGKSSDNKPKSDQIVPPHDKNG